MARTGTSPSTPRNGGWVFMTSRPRDIISDNDRQQWFADRPFDRPPSGFGQQNTHSSLLECVPCRGGASRLVPGHRVATWQRSIPVGVAGCRGVSAGLGRAPVGVDRGSVRHRALSAVQAAMRPLGDGGG